MRDPFTVLGVDEDAGDEEIRRRYLALVREFPPDRAPDRFRDYRAAYEALNDERKRLETKLLRTNTAALSQLSMAALQTGAPGRSRASRRDRGGAARRGNRADRDGVTAAGTRTEETRWTTHQAGAAEPVQCLLDTVDESRGRRTIQGKRRIFIPLFVEVAGLRSEVRTESRLVKEALDQFRGVFDTLRASQATLQQELDRRGPIRATGTRRRCGRCCWTSSTCATGWWRPCNLAGTVRPALVRSAAAPERSRAGRRGRRACA